MRQASAFATLGICVAIACGVGGILWIALIVLCAIHDRESNGGTNPSFYYEFLFGCGLLVLFFLGRLDIALGEILIMDAAKSLLKSQNDECSDGQSFGNRQNSYT